MGWVIRLAAKYFQMCSALLCFQEFSIMLSTAASVLLLLLLLMYLYLVAQAKNTEHIRLYALLVLEPSSNLLTISDYTYIYIYRIFIFYFF